MRKFFLFILLTIVTPYLFAQRISAVNDLSQVAYMHLQAGRLIEAEQQYYKLHRADTTNVALILSLAEISQRRGNQRQARSYYFDALKNDSSNFNAHKQLALLAKSRAGVPNLEWLKKRT